jgi:hypothetical protein
MARQRATRTAVLSGSATWPSATSFWLSSGLLLIWGLQCPESTVGVRNGHLRGPEVGVLGGVTTSKARSGWNASTIFKTTCRWVS